MLKFALRHEATLRVHGLALTVGEVIYVGRAPSCAVVVEDQSVSGQHLELFAEKHPVEDGPPRLWARDLSRNGTGILDAETGCKEVRPLQKDEAEEIRDGAELVVPLRRNPHRAGVTHSDEGRHHYTVEILDKKGANGSLPGARLKEPMLLPPIDTSGLPDAWDSATQTGRWRYEEKLGEGGLGVVYRAYDTKGGLGEVAVKVLKCNPRTPNRDARHAFAMWRESQWSMRRLHNAEDPRYDAEASSLFAKYLEDHTGFDKIGPLDFDGKRRQLETPGYCWTNNTLPKLPPRPYVVMELVRGETLQHAIDREWSSKAPEEGASVPAFLSDEEKRQVLVDAARALQYLEKFQLIHRDFRGCNMHLICRAGQAGGCKLKVLDLGVMIHAEPGMETNHNMAVQAFSRRGETEENRRRYDWLPWEVRNAADGSGPSVNYREPSHTFDVFSLGVLVLHMIIGKTEAREQLDIMTRGETWVLDPTPIGLSWDFVLRMLLNRPKSRPRPSEVLVALEGKSTDGAADVITRLPTSDELLAPSSVSEKKPLDRAPWKELPRVQVKKQSDRAPWEEPHSVPREAQAEERAKVKKQAAEAVPALAEKDAEIDRAHEEARRRRAEEERAKAAEQAAEIAQARVEAELERAQDEARRRRVEEEAPVMTQTEKPIPTVEGLSEEEDGFNYEVSNELREALDLGAALKDPMGKEAAAAKIDLLIEQAALQKALGAADPALGVAEAGHSAPGQLCGDLQLTKAGHTQNDVATTVAPLCVSVEAVAPPVPVAEVESSTPRRLPEQSDRSRSVRRNPSESRISPVVEVESSPPRFCPNEPGKTKGTKRKRRESRKKTKLSPPPTKRLATPAPFEENGRGSGAGPKHSPTSPVPSPEAAPEEPQSVQPAEPAATPPPLLEDAQLFAPPPPQAPPPPLPATTAPQPVVASLPAAAAPQPLAAPRLEAAAPQPSAASSMVAERSSLSQAVAAVTSSKARQAPPVSPPLKAAGIMPPSMLPASEVPQPVGQLSSPPPAAPETVARSDFTKVTVSKASRPPPSAPPPPMLPAAFPADVMQQYWQQQVAYQQQLEAQLHGQYALYQQQVAAQQQQQQQLAHLQVGYGRPLQPPDPRFPWGR